MKKSSPKKKMGEPKGKNGTARKKGGPKKKPSKKNDVLKKKLWLKKNGCAKAALSGKLKPRKPGLRSSNRRLPNPCSNLVPTPRVEFANGELPNTALPA
jgi:hypothetical protein